MLILPLGSAKSESALATAVTDSDDYNDDDRPLSDRLEAALIASQAESLSAQLIVAIAPYFNGLAEMSRLMYARHGNGDVDPLAHVSFRRDLSRAVENVLRLRTRLDNSKYKASFLWPERGEAFDPARMQVPYAHRNDNPAYTVAFTKFPGVKVEYLRQHVYETEVASKACVVLRIEAARNDTRG